MSNYPPGVTGNEYQIAGPDWTGQEERSCGKPDVEILLPADDVQFFVELASKVLTGEVLVKPGSTPVDRALYHLSRALLAYENGEKVEVGECPYKGTVDAEVYQGILTWTCPMCATEHEEDVSER